MCIYSDQYLSQLAVILLVTQRVVVFIYSQIVSIMLCSPSFGTKISFPFSKEYDTLSIKLFVG